MAVLAPHNIAKIGMAMIPDPQVELNVSCYGSVSPMARSRTRNAVKLTVCSRRAHLYRDVLPLVKTAADPANRADSTKFTRATAWRPTVTLREGLRQTIAFYRRHFSQYVEVATTRESA